MKWLFNSFFVAEIFYFCAVDGKLSELLQKGWIVIDNGVTNLDIQGT